MKTQTPVQKLRKVWRAMIRRCTDPNDKSYPNYGGRGIAVCHRWLDFSLFVADMGLPLPGKTIERIDNDSGYCPENCCWADRKTQNRNQRSNRLIEHNGETHCLGEWAERLGLDPSFIRRRMSVQGMSFAQAISVPKRYSVWRKSRMEAERGLA